LIIESASFDAAAPIVEQDIGRIFFDIFADIFLLVFSEIDLGGTIKYEIVHCCLLYWCEVNIQKKEREKGQKREKREGRREEREKGQKRERGRGKRGFAFPLPLKAEGEFLSDFGKKNGSFAIHKTGKRLCSPAMRTAKHFPSRFRGRRLPFGKAFFEVARGDGRGGFHPLLRMKFLKNSPLVAFGDLK
jgi:hypothetical protein